MSIPRRVTLTIDGKVHEVTVEAEGLRAVVNIACPGCKRAAPILVGGTGISHREHDHYVADGFALCCRHPLGKLRAFMSTLFGLEEDEAVLHGRPRVY